MGDQKNLRSNVCLWGKDDKTIGLNERMCFLKIEFITNIGYYFDYNISLLYEA